MSRSISVALKNIKHTQPYVEFLRTMQEFRLLSRMPRLGRTMSFGLPFKALNRDIWLICLSNVIGAFGEGMYFWVFPLYIRSLQADYVQLGIVFSALMGVAAIVPLPGGFLADRFDRKKILILSWTPWIFAPLVYSFAANWVQLIPGTVCWGASMIGLPAVSAYVITSVNDKKQLSFALSFVWSSYSLSYIFAPAVGGFLATIVGMRWILRSACILAAISTGVFFLLHSQHPRKEEHDTEDESSLPLAEEKRLWRKMLMWAGLLTTASFFMSIARPYVPTLLSETISLSEFQVGLFGSFNYAGMTLIGIAFGRLGDKWRKSGTIAMCYILYIISVVPLLLIKEPITLMGAAFLLGGSAVSGTLVSSFVGIIAPRTKRGLWISIPQTLSLLAGFAAPYLGGYIYTVSPFYAFAVSASGLPFLVLFALLKLKD